MQDVQPSRQCRSIQIRTNELLCMYGMIALQKTRVGISCTNRANISLSLIRIYLYLSVLSVFDYFSLSELNLYDKLYTLFTYLGKLKETLHVEVRNEKHLKSRLSLTNVMKYFMKWIYTYQNLN